MTPKDKARELTSKMLEYQPFETKERTEDICREFAKQCALITVDEIIDVLNNESNPSISVMCGTPGDMTLIGGVKYWQEVKQEIQKL